MSVVEFWVYGIPKPQGSKKAFAVNGRAMMAEAGGTAHASWRNAVAYAAHDNIPASGRLDGPLNVELTFQFAMPMSRTKATRALGIAPKTTAPDVDKLQRAVFDGLMAGGLIRDDATICGVIATKHETLDWSGVRILIEQVAA